MPRKLLYDSQRGWYGREGHFNSVLRMSVASMFATNVKNERERFLHRKAITQIHDDRTDSLQSMDREMKKIRRELTDMSAYRIVYRQNSFIKWEEKKRSDDDKKTSAKHVGFKETKTQKLPPIFGNGIRTRDERADDNPDSGVSNTMLPRGAGNLMLWRGFGPNEVRIRDREQSTLTEMSGTIEGTKNSKGTKSNMDKNDKLKRSVNVRKLKLRERQHDKVSTVLPEGCKGVFFLRRFIDKETDRFLKEMSPSNIRRKNAEKLIKNVQIPRFIDHRRSTSGIMREYQIYRSKTCVTETGNRVIAGTSKS